MAGAPQQVRLPSGVTVWVRPAALSGRAGADGPADVGLGEAAAAVVQIPGFIDLVGGVVDSVRMALDRHRPDAVEVEFGVELNVKTGAVLSLLTEAGGTAHVKVTASWKPPGDDRSG